MSAGLSHLRHVSQDGTYNPKGHRISEVCRGSLRRFRSRGNHAAAPGPRGHWRAKQRTSPILAWDLVVEVVVNKGSRYASRVCSFIHPLCLVHVSIVSTG